MSFIVSGDMEMKKPLYCAFSKTCNKMTDHPPPQPVISLELLGRLHQGIPSVSKQPDGPALVKTYPSQSLGFYESSF